MFARGATEGLCDRSVGLYPLCRREGVGSALTFPLALGGVVFVITVEERSFAFPTAFAEGGGVGRVQVWGWTPRLPTAIVAGIVGVVGVVRGVGLLSL